MKFLKSILISCVMLISFSSFAVTDTNRTITSVGVQGGGGYVVVSPATSTTCLYNVLYFDANTIGGRLIYGVLLAAYSTGMPLKRIDYAVDGTTRCTISLLNY